MVNGQLTIHQWPLTIDHSPLAIHNSSSCSTHLPMADKLHELLAASTIFVKDAQYRAVGDDGILLLHAAHHHAEVACFGDHRHARGLQHFHQRMRDFGSHTFLHLQASRKDINDAGDLAQSHDAAVGHVGHVTFAVKRQEVMFTHAVKIDILDDHHLIDVFLEQSVVQDLHHVGAIAG